MYDNGYITINENKKQIVINISTILYAVMINKTIEIHISGGKIYKTRTTFAELCDKLGDSFIKAHRGCVVAVKAIHNINDTINLNNGEALLYTQRKRKKIIAEFNSKLKRIVTSFSNDSLPKNNEQYHEHYITFDNMPFAFTDIEMVFNDKNHAIDWIFRYGNAALARIEKLPLERLIGSSFGSLFANMDSKWLKIYERATLYGKTLEITDYSPEIDTYLKVICFPTFKGHCGCILFDVENVKSIKNSTDVNKTLLTYVQGLTK